MYYEPLKRKANRKLEQAMKVYADRIFIKVGELSNVQAYYTKEHLRNVPQGEGWTSIEKGTAWGGEWQNLWIKGSFACDAAVDGKKIYALSRAGGCEQLFFVNGVPKGIFNIKNTDYVGGNHGTQYIGVAKAGEKFDLAFECYAGHFCVGCAPDENFEYPDIEMPDFMQCYKGVDICVMDETVKDMVFDLREVLAAAKVVPDNNFLKARAQRTLDKVLNVLVLDPKHCDEKVWHESVEKTLAITREMFTGTNSRIFGKVGILGHSHMDTAWLWPVNETIRKCARTYSNAMSLMEQYPEYRFIQSSALHCEWMKDYYPDIFEEMKKRVAEGLYEPNGGVYVECDCNVTSGELMIRQFLKGQQFTRKYFDYTADSFWLPDTFGYNANIPQIMLGCDVKYFYTTKISWNEVNRFPFESFNWRGIDGSEVLTHYNLTHCFPDVEDCLRAVDGIQLKDTTDMRLLAFGFGDGGGGPTPGMIESARRVSKMDGMPEIEMCSISDFMQELDKTRAQLPTYDGELYLELHRGTLTQMHDVKRKNRLAEFAMRSMEYFNVLASKPANVDSEKWCKILLTNQFHDILPGTCITPVYEKFNTEMDELLDNYRAATAEYANGITEDAADTITLYNTLSFGRKDVHSVENAGGYAKDVPSQSYTDVCGREMLDIGSTELPAFAAVTVELADTAVEAESAFSYDGKVAETPFATITFDDDGFIASYVDKASGRELRKNGGAPLNALLFGEDLPEIWDNWDLEFDVIERLEAIKGFKGREVVTDGAVELRLRSTYDFGEGSSLVQDMVMYADTPRIDFHTLVDWNEKHRILKAGFDLDVASKTVRNEIQYGHVERAVTRNTSLEYAKFEVCNYKWTDISESRFGAAVLNDCKYGITVLDGNLRLSLHRGGTHPDVTGDKGVHEMTYSLFVHNGGFSAENVVKPAYELNIPAVAVKGKAKNEQSFLTIDADNVICEVVKPVESGENGYVLRLYECEGTRAKANVALSRAGKEIYEANMLEDLKAKLEAKDSVLSLDFKPFEIKTIVVLE